MQGKSTATFNVTGAAKYGVSHSTFSLVFEGATYTGFPATMTMIQGSGNIPYALTIMDSRGLMVQIPGSIPVLALAKPNREEQLTSYEEQVDYYTQFIHSKIEWEFVKVYTDADTPYGQSPKARER